MKSNNQNIEHISGNVERITFHNPDNGFSIIKIIAATHRDLVTVVGNIPMISVGEYIQCQGVWFNDKNYGLQFKASFLKNTPPTSLEGIEKYLGSGLIKGIGPVFAKKLVSAFKEETFNVIENSPDKLFSIHGVGRVKVASLCQNWSQQKIIRGIMVFLQSHGVGTARATRIYKTYGEEAIKIVSENPYRLAKDIRGIGFISSDQIARNLGIAADSIIRARAGINHILLEATSNGHCGLPKHQLLEQTQKLLDVDLSVIEHGLSEELKHRDVIQDKLGEIEAIFSSVYYHFEANIANMLSTINTAQLPWKSIDSNELIPWAEKELNIELASNQRLAVETALRTKAMIITGGPGTGKTTLVNSILTILSKQKLSIKLCAPTGRAAKRLSETTGMEALTIHRLLGRDNINFGFNHNENNQLICDYLVIDEASMVDVSLFHALLKALPRSSGILLVGDIDQLPSVGAGFVLGDIINSNRIKTIQLNRVFRQETTSNIIAHAHLINKGIIPDLAPPQENEESDFYFIETEDENLQSKLVHLITERIPAKFGYHSRDDIQVLCPMQRGGSGVRSLNVELQKAINPNPEVRITKFGQTYAAGDKVIQTENNYDKEVFNGDIGIVQSVDEIEQELTIKFDNNNIVYDYTDMDQITLAYAITIHKSQGSEYPVVIIPLTMQSYMMLQRNLVYTGITRGKKLVIIIGQKKALAMAIKNNRGVMRYTRLRECLRATDR